jgi:hypothetical protein
VPPIRSDARRSDRAWFAEHDRFPRWARDARVRRTVPIGRAAKPRWNPVARLALTLFCPPDAGPRNPAGERHLLSCCSTVSYDPAGLSRATRWRCAAGWIRPTGSASLGSAAALLVVRSGILSARANCPTVTDWSGSPTASLFLNETTYLNWQATASIRYTISIDSLSYLSAACRSESQYCCEGGMGSMSLARWTKGSDGVRVLSWKISNRASELGSASSCDSLTAWMAVFG